jgi:hypothetical protein
MKIQSLKNWCADNGILPDAKNIEALLNQINGAGYKAIEKEPFMVFSDSQVPMKQHVMTYCLENNLTDVIYYWLENKFADRPYCLFYIYSN